MWRYRCKLYGHGKPGFLTEVSKWKITLVLPWYLIITLSMATLGFSTTCRTYVKFRSLLLCLDFRLASVVIYEGCLRHLRHEAPGVIVMPHYSCSWLLIASCSWSVSPSTARRRRTNAFCVLQRGAVSVQVKFSRCTCQWEHGACLFHLSTGHFGRQRC